jgi:AcrR family transcriptional regulator
MSTASTDRRARRRQQTIDEVLDIAVEVMTEQGAGGLSLGEIARRMGIRPPSLYVYFPSKHAIYDALFARGAQEIFDVTQEATHGFAASDDLADTLLRAGSAMVRWCVANPAYSQLLFWRPVPGFVPSQEAYAPAVELVASSQRAFTELQRQGMLRTDVPVDQILRDWMIVIAGITSQQLSNAPDDSYEDGRFTSALPGLVAMFCRTYGGNLCPTNATSALKTKSKTRSK